MGFYLDGPCEFTDQILSPYVALLVPEITAIEVLDGVANPNLREEDAVGDRGWYCSKES